MKKRNECPVCQQAIDLPTDRRFAGYSCESCSGQLWVIYRQDVAYLFDSNDSELFSHYRGKFRAEDQARFAANGWVSSKSLKKNLVFDKLVKYRNFTIQKQPAIELPNESIELDFSNVLCDFPIPKEEQTTIENKLRQLTIESFIECSASDLCFVIDVNHSEYSFIPSQVDWPVEDGWPVFFTPFSEYLAFNTRCFSQGLFHDPRSRHIYVYGEAFQKNFANEFSSRLVS